MLSIRPEQLFLQNWQPFWLTLIWNIPWGADAEMFSLKSRLIITGNVFLGRVWCLWSKIKVCKQEIQETHGETMCKKFSLNKMFEYKYSFLQIKCHFQTQQYWAKSLKINVLYIHSKLSKEPHIFIHFKNIKWCCVWRLSKTILGRSVT